MKNKYTLKLVDGKFAPAQAGKVLMGLISYKINYHQMELFSNEEMFGKDISNSKKRIEELKSTNDSLKEIIRTISDKAKMVEVKGLIEITVLSNK
jgi:hypothetical protein